MYKSQNVLVLGGASWNTMVHMSDFPEQKPQTITDARFVEGVGSTGIGKAFSLKALGFNPTLHIAVGDDALGDKVIRACEKRVIETLAERYHGETAQHLNLMDDQGGRISIFKTNGPNEVHFDTTRINAEIEKADVIYVNLAASAIPLLPAVAASSAEVVADLHDYEPHNSWYDKFIEVADIVQLSDEKVSDEDELANDLMERGASIVAITKGKHGARLFSEFESLFIEPVPAKMLDSNGAGDTFCVALVQSLLAGTGLGGAGRFAAKCAAKTVQVDEIAPMSFV